MRGYVERMEMLAYSMPEGKEPTHEQVMGTYFGNPVVNDCKHPTEEILHEYDESSVLGDSYWCGLCNELLQVG